MIIIIFLKIIVHYFCFKLTRFSIFQITNTKLNAYENHVSQPNICFHYPLD